jgi:tRNA A-37 threonylcarbamoyl transferase component Bud32
VERISGFPLNDIITKVLESDWAPVCEQAIEVISKIAEHDFINFDIETRNIIVQCSDECSYQVFFLDFG